VIDFAGLQVALGLIFLYLVLALVCSALNEAIAGARGWRAHFLRVGIANLLDPDDPVQGQLHAQTLYAHPLVNGLIRPVGRKGRPRYPSYLPARVFAAALLDLDRKGTTQSVEAAIKSVPSAQTRQALTTLWSTSDHQNELFQKAVEGWYDDAMERVSGWYRRRVHSWLWVIAIVLTLSLNVDTIRVADHLWKDKTVRDAVIARTQHPPASAKASVTNVAASVTNLQQLKLPIGWWVETKPRGSWGWSREVLLKLLGLLITASALTLGAPFWFDTLGKIANLRTAGNRPAPSATQNVP
jgi:hypothetical protein